MPSLKPKKIAVINSSGTLDDPWVVGFYGELHRGVADEAARLGLDYDFFDSTLSLKSFLLDKTFAAYSGALGIIPETHPDFASWRKIQKKIPCVNMMTGKMSPSENYVGTDEHEGMKIILKHLTAEGHRSIGFFAPFGYTHERPRFAAYQKWCVEKKLSLLQDWIVGFDIQTGEPNHKDALNFSAREKEKKILGFSRNYLDQKKKPEAMIFAADSYAYLFWEAALERGLRVPEDIALVGIGDRSHFVLPRERRPLTTLRQDHDAIGAVSVRVLSEMISGKRKRTHQHVLLPPSLRIRRSSLRRNLASDPKDEFQRNVHDYIEAHLGGSLKLGLAARRFELSPSHFSKRFREIFGLSFSDSVAQRRLDRAKVLLKETSESVKKIMEKVGYPNHRRFYEKFRARFGATPQEIRQGKTDKLSHP